MGAPNTHRRSLLAGLFATPIVAAAPAAAALPNPVPETPGLLDLGDKLAAAESRLRKAIDLKAVKSNGYAFQIEMSFRAWKKGFRVIEIPIVFADRTEGESKMSPGIVQEAVWMVWRLRWWALTGKV